MSQTEVATLVAYGRAWLAKLWMARSGSAREVKSGQDMWDARHAKMNNNNNTVGGYSLRPTQPALTPVDDDEAARTRASLIQEINSLPLLARFTVKRGFQPYDPFVKGPTEKGYTYYEIVNAAASQPDGGVSWAANFIRWVTSADFKLDSLPEKMQSLAVITHFAEVARGYEFDLTKLYTWLGEIASARSRDDAVKLWSQVNTRFPPSLTYKDDASTDFENEPTRMQT